MKSKTYERYRKFVNIYSRIFGPLVLILGVLWVFLDSSGISKKTDVDLSIVFGKAIMSFVSLWLGLNGIGVLLSIFSIHTKSKPISKSSLVFKYSFGLMGITFTFLAVFTVTSLILTSLPFNRPPAHGLIDFGFFKCNSCKSLIGGIFGKGPIKEFHNKTSLFHIHHWTKTTLDSFKLAASDWYGYNWSKDIQFWNPPIKRILYDEKYHAGDTTSDGKLIFYVWKFGIRTLVDDKAKYGIMVWYNKFDKNPRIEYEFSSQPDRKFIRTSDYQSFLSQIATVPLGDTILLYDVCSVGSHQGLNENVMKGIKSYCKKHSIILLSPYVICTCKSWPEG